MADTFRALCAELLRGLDENRHPEVRYPGHLRLVMADARTALSQPEPEGPTVMQIIELAEEIEAAELGQVDLVRAALARWKSAAPQSISTPSCDKTSTSTDE